MARIPVVSLLVMLASGLAGCDSAGTSQAEISGLTSQCAALKKHNDSLKAAFQGLQSEKAALDKAALLVKQENEDLMQKVAGNNDIVKIQNDEVVMLRQQVASLTTELAELKKAALKPPVSGAAAGQEPARSGAAAGLFVAPPPAAPKAPPRDEIAIADAKKEQDDLEAQIADLVPKVGLARDRVMSQVRATIDARLSPPDGHAGHYPYGYPYPYPGVRPGDFRSQRDKEAAINQAKEELRPLETELKRLKDELAKVKKRLAELLAPSK